MTGRRALLLGMLAAAPDLASDLARAADRDGAGPAPAAADLSPGDGAAIRGVITRQMDAFRRDDAAAAYGFAAPNIREAFPTADGFLDMVRRSYPPVYRPRQAEFSELAVRNGQVVQEVELVGPDGKAVLAVYSMVRGGGSGGWLISGCTLLPSVRMST